MIIERDEIMENMIGKIIGTGGTSSVYEWGNDEVIKIFKPNVPIEVIKNEQHVGKMLNDLSLCTPKYIKTIEFDNKLAIIYERAYGRTLAEILIETTDKSEMAASFAKIHYEIHQCYMDELPSQQEMYSWKISKMSSYFKKEVKKMEDLFESLPIENKLCHGDFHPLNILVDCDKYITLDWNGICSGSPLLDVAWSYLTLNSPSIELMYGQAMAKVVTEFSKDYLKYYCSYSNVDKYDVLKYLPLVAVRRLYDNISCETDMPKYENDWLKDIISNNK